MELWTLNLANDIKNEWVKHIQYTNVDTDSVVKNTDVSIPSLEQLRQIRVDCFKTQPALVTAIVPYHLLAVLQKSEAE